MDDVVNDLPNVAGLHYILKNLLSLPADIISLYKDEWELMYKILPEIPKGKKNGIMMYSPAEKYGKNRTNAENPELYAVFPFSLCNISTKNLQLGIDTYNNRIVKLTDCWTQDGQQAAMLGLTEEAKDNLLAKL